ncbi:MAG: glycine hydroxymethyltransferase, partial [Acidimicrobiales bacterium]
AERLLARGIPVITGGTDNHLVLVDVRRFELTGRQAESALGTAGITLNRNVVPNETNGPWYTSGLRLGTPAVTTLGMGNDDMREVADVIADVLHATSAGVVASGPNKGKSSRVEFRLEEAVADAGRSRVTDLLARHPLYPEIEL